MRVLIADDERPARSELRHILEPLLPGAEFQEADSGGSAIEFMSEDRFDILFLDVDLGDMKGTAVAAAARRLQPGAPVVFATAFSEHAVKAFELGAADYLLKPFDPQRIAKAVQRLLEGAAPSQAAQSGPGGPPLGKLSVNVEKRIVLLDLADVAYVETKGRGSAIHTVRGEYLDSAPIGILEKRLAGGKFFRIHKSYLVNLDYIAELFPWYGSSFALTLRGYEKEVLPISRGQIKELRALLNL